MVYLTKKMTFSASHRIYNPNLSEEENLKLFKKCSNKNGHGHNFVLEVTICGETNPLTGYLIDLKELKEIININVIDKLDHSNLNYDIDFFQNVIPTSENIALFVWQALENKIPNAKLYKIKIAESETSAVEYFGN